ncbi:hypothetical protein ACWEVY_28855 [Streptomyces longwoodensis]
MAAVTDDFVEAGTSALDAEEIRQTIDSTWAMQLATSTREEIEAATAEIIKHANALRSQPLGEDEDQAALHIIRMADRQLAPSNRPSPRAHAHDSFGYLKDTTAILASLLSLYEKQRARES